MSELREAVGTGCLVLEDAEALGRIANEVA
jgi:hypothetical protein